VQQRSAATAPSKPDFIRAHVLLEQRQRPVTTPLPLDGKETVCPNRLWAQSPSQQEVRSEVRLESVRTTSSRR
jgi:hypothetical protein